VNDVLRLELACRKGLLGRSLLIDIRFINAGSSDYCLTFSNKTHDAERLGLRVLDDSGRRIDPSPGLMIRPKDPRIDEHVIRPGGVWVYTLKGRFRGNAIEFPGASYAIPAGIAYRVQFEYLGICSNSIELPEW
jgi:hypothetical protein